MIHAVTAETPDGTATMTGYVGNLPSPDVERLRAVLGVYAVTSVSSVPFALLRPLDCLDLVSVADRDGWVWHLSPVVLDSGDLGVSLRVYEDPQETPTLYMVWHEEQLVTSRISAGTSKAVRERE